MIAETLTHYRIVEKIGEGGMGVVYRARDERLDRDVAIKVLPTGTLADDTARKRFRKEALALAKLSHPNIGVIYDFDTQEGVDFLVMEYIAGATLAERLTAGALPEKEVLAVGAQIVAALEEAHEHDVVHRDLKPGNILVTPKGQAKVLDFGLAKLLRPESEISTTDNLSSTAALAGTLPYMSPERLRGEPADARSDIYGAGAVLYEMATGQRAFREELATRLADVILHQPTVSPRALNARVSPDLERIILKCLDKEPENRYQSAKELSVDLRRLVSPSAVLPVTTPRKFAQHYSRYAIIAASLVVVLLAGVLVGLNVGGARDRLLGRTAPPRIASLAVLPLANLSGDATQEYFSDGMTEALITDLSRISALRVISRTSVMQYKGTKKPMPQIAKELNVDGVVEGSVQLSGDKVRITAQLIEGPTDRHLWVESYERDLHDILALQSDVAKTIAREIRVKLTPQEQARLGETRPVITEAYQLYLKGRYHWNRRTEESARKGLGYFEQAIQKDPAYAPAYAGLADSFIALLDHENLPPKEALSKAKEAARKALDLDETAEAHTSLAHASIHDWDWVAADRESQRAVQLNPRDASARLYRAVYLGATGRLEDAIAEDRQALEIDPLSLIINSHLGDLLSRAGRLDQGIAQLRRTLELDPNFFRAHLWLGEAYQQKGLHGEAIAELKRAVTLGGGGPEALAALAHAYAVGGERREALKLLGELKEQSRRRFVPATDFAFVCIGLGQKEQAFVWLEQAYQERSGWLAFAKIDPRFDGLRSDPRFQDLLRRIGLPP